MGTPDSANPSRDQPPSVLASQQVEHSPGETSSDDENLAELTERIRAQRRVSSKTEEARQAQERAQLQRLRAAWKEPQPIRWVCGKLCFAKCVCSADRAVGPYTGGQEGEREASTETRRLRHQLGLGLTACDSKIEKWGQTSCFKKATIRGRVPPCLDDGGAPEVHTGAIRSSAVLLGTKGRKRFCGRGWREYP